MAKAPKPRTASKAGSRRGRGALDYTLGALDRTTVEPVAPRGGLRQELLDLVHAPRGPIDPAAHTWAELAPGIRLKEVYRDPARNVRGCLVWATPGSKTSRHRHLGDEVILVLQGGLRDERGTYHAGQVCRSRQGSVHTEEVVGGDDCFCYVVYYGEHEPA
jgi:anti-sigma factor ChrR (cupin superfamily)